METYLLDANVVLRFLRWDRLRVAVAADALFARAECGEIRLILDCLILAEVVFVLQSFYKLGREVIADALFDLINSGGTVETGRPELLDDMLERHPQHPQVDFGDAMLGALAAEQNISIASFDRDLDRFKNVVRLEPPLRLLEAVENNLVNLSAMRIYWRQTFYPAFWKKLDTR